MTGPADSSAGVPLAPQPALTESEWRTLKLWSVGKMIGGKVRGMVVLDLPDAYKHGAAACALYGEPFGFTQADVDLLQTLMRMAAFQFRDTTAVQLSDLSLRIAALLPPADVP